MAEYDDDDDDDFLSAQAATSTITREVMEALKKASWLENGQLSESRLHSLLEVMIYVQFLSPTERHAASSISFSHDDLILHYGTKISKKLSPKSSLATSDTPAPVAPIQHNPQPVNVAPVQHRHVPSPVTCTYCSKQGHKSLFCYRRKRDSAKTTLSRHNTPTTHFSE